jgi:hypothetical protein
VESTLFRARRRLEREFEEIEAGRRCEAIELVIARISEGVDSPTDMRRLSRHARGCSTCRCRARQMGVEPLRSRRAAARAAAVLPLPGFLRRRFSASHAAPPPGPDAGALTTLVGPGAHVGAAVAERAAALVAAIAMAGAGGIVVGSGTPHTALPTAGHHRGAAAGVHRSRVPAADRQGRQRARQAAPARRREWRQARSHSATAPRTGKPHGKAPATGAGAAAGLPPAGKIDAPAAPNVPAAPRVRLTAPAKPDVPVPSVSGPSAPVTLPGGAPATPDTGLGTVGGLDARGG